MVLTPQINSQAAPFSVLQQIDTLGQLAIFVSTDGPESAVARGHRSEHLLRLPIPKCHSVRDESNLQRGLQVHALGLTNPTLSASPLFAAEFLVPSLRPAIPKKFDFEIFFKKNRTVFSLFPVTKMRR